MTLHRKVTEFVGISSGDGECFCFETDAPMAAAPKVTAPKTNPASHLPFRMGAVTGGAKRPEPPRSGATSPFAVLLRSNARST